MDGYITAARAVLESVVRTAVDLAGGALMTFLTLQLPTFDRVTTGGYWVALGLAVWTAVTAGVKRKFWPMSTDRMGTGRKDLHRVPR